MYRTLLDHPRDTHTAITAYPTETTCHFSPRQKSFAYYLSAGLLLSVFAIQPIASIASASEDIAIRINAGGGDYVDSNGHLWSADTGFNTGKKGSTSSPINGLGDDGKLVQTSRWDAGTAPELEYNFPVPDGDYKVNLYFSEHNEGTFGIGLRTFDVELQGQKIIDDLDIYQEVGANNALVKSFMAKVSDGNAKIRFFHEVNNPKISAIEILSVDPSTPPMGDNGFAVRINAGGSDYQDTAGNVWVADTGYNTGKKGFASSSIAGLGSDGALVQTSRWDFGTAPELEYDIAVPDGDYKVNLYFAEHNEGTFGNGLRLFDVELQGQKVLDNLDIYREVGANNALAKSFVTKVHDGSLKIRFLHEVNHPKISAIEVLGTTMLPVAVTPTNGTVSIDEDETVNINTIGNTNGGSVALVGAPSAGAASVQYGNLITYIPNDGYVGQDSITYKITESDGAVTVSSLTVYVGCTSCGVTRQVGLSWDSNPKEVLGYRVFYGPTIGTVSQQISDLDVASGEVDEEFPAMTYHVTPEMSVNVGDTMCFRVKAYNTTGESAFSTAACETI